MHGRIYKPASDLLEQFIRDVRRHLLQNEIKELAKHNAIDASQMAVNL